MRRPLIALAILVAGPLSMAAALAALTGLLVRRARRAYPARGRYLVVDGVRLHVVEAGAGRPVVFIHGAKGSTLDATLSVFDAVARRYRAIALDRPGSGHSGAARGDQSPRAQARLINAALRMLEADRPILVGHSLGAAVVMSYLVDFPGEAAGGVSVSGYTAPFNWRGSPLSRLLGVPVLGRLLAATLIVPLGRLVAPAVVRRAAFPAAAPAVWTRAAVAMALTPAGVLADAAALRAADPDLVLLCARYREIDVPLVLVHGVRDHVVWPRMSEQVHRRVRGSELVLLEDAGHLPQFAHPEAIVTAVDRVDELARRREPGGESAAEPDGGSAAGPGAA